MQGPGLLKDYWTGLKDNADDLFDLGKSDLAFAGSIFSCLSTVRLHFNSSRCLFFCLLSSTAFCQLSLPSPFFTLLCSGYLNPPIPVFLSPKRVFQHRALSSASPALTEGKWCVFQLWEECLRTKLSITLLFSILLPPFPPLCIHVIHMHIWRVAVSWGGNGWLEAGCLPQRRAEIHNLWRKNPSPALLGKSCKSLHFTFLLALGSLLQITCGDIFRGLNSSK